MAFINRHIPNSRQKSLIFYDTYRQVLRSQESIRLQNQFQDQHFGSRSRKARAKIYVARQRKLISKTSDRSFVFGQWNAIHVFTGKSTLCIQKTLFGV